MLPTTAIQNLLLFGLFSMTLNAHAQDALVEDDSFYIQKKSTVEIGQRLSVDTGEAIYSAGSIIEGESIEVLEPKTLFISGAMFIPFRVNIERGELHLKKISKDWRYFCADSGLAKATLPVIGSLITEGDCVGIREANNKQVKEWVVDNSHYNGIDSVWSKAMTADETEHYAVKINVEPFKIKSLKTITFDGYYGGQLHFTHTEINNHSKDAKEFIFDFHHEPIIIGIKGHHIKILEANNINASYEWLRLKD